MKTAICTSLLLAGVASAHADVLWGQAVSGASITDVSALYPGAIDVPPDPKKTLRTGAVARLKIDGLSIVDESFEATFYFLNDRLDQVSLTLKKATGINDCDAINDRLTEALRSKYGAELARKKEGGLGLSASASWAAGKTGISTTMLSYSSPASCNIYITYNNQISSTAHKL